jgi:hypothetical protein
MGFLSVMRGRFLLHTTGPVIRIYREGMFGDKTCDRNVKLVPSWAKLRKLSIWTWQRKDWVSSWAWTFP